MSEDTYYKRWSDPEVVRKFSNKSRLDFFQTENKFLQQIHSELITILDIGCASGRMLELLRDYSPNIEYTGVDISELSIEIGRRLYPDSNFVLGNALEMNFDCKFTLVNATGVFQHEPKFEDLLKRMVVWSSKYVLFDVKLANIDDHIVDREISYSGTNDRLYFNILSPTIFIESLLRLSDVSTISVFGYETPKNSVTTIPDSVSCLYSTAVLLELGEKHGHRAELNLELPSELISRTL